MGAAGSVSHSYTAQECQELYGDLFCLDLFNEFKDSDGKIRESVLHHVFSHQTDVFLTHDWGCELGVDNHARVSKVNDALKNLGLKTWFDSDRMEGNIKKKMVSGINFSRCVIVFVTKRYLEPTNLDG